MPLISHSAHPHIATLSDLPDIAAHPLSDWPPPGTHIGPPGWDTVEPPYPVFGPGVGDRSISLEIVADDGNLPQSGFWWTTIGNLLAPIPNWASKYGGKLAELLLELDLGPLYTIASIPVVWRATEGLIMRWLSTTYRGSLAGTVEEFQFKIDLGNPGSDPDLSEAGATTLAEQLAGLWNTAWSSGPAAWPSSVKFTEIGVVQKEQTSASDKYGKGGNLSQSYGTAWFMYPTGTVVSGSSGAVALPFEVATAVTLHTDHRGPSGRGRLYLPPTHINSMVAGGVYSDDYVNSCNSLISLYLEAVMVNTPYVPVVVSRRRLILNEVKTIATGHVPDSQRRRRRSQNEAPITVTLS